MIRRLLSLLAFVLLSAVLAGCGGGGGSTQAGIGGTGITTTGTITGFGSIFVNGIEFDTSEAVVVVNGVETGGEADLKLGMVVTVEGVLNDDGVTGVAERVIYTKEVEAPVTADPVEDPDKETKTFTTVGKTVVVDRATTVFEGDTPDFSYETLGKDDVVEISGYVDQNGVLQATRVERKGKAPTSQPTPMPLEVELKGVVSGFNGVDRFNLDGAEVSFDPNGLLTDLSGVPEGIADGVTVTVTGTLSGTGDRIDATRIVAPEQPTPPAPGEPGDGAVVIEGIIGAFTDVGEFWVGGQQVDASGAERVPADLALGLGAKVEVRGTLVGGVVIADVVEQRGGDIRIQAPVVSAEPGTRTVVLAVSPVEVGLLVRLGAKTRLVDATDGHAALGLEEIFSGDFLKLRGYRDADGTVVATSAERAEIGDVVIQAPLEAMDADARTLTLLGARFGTDAATVFEDTADEPLAEDFFAVDRAGALVRVGDRRVGGTTDGIADAVDLESETPAPEMEDSTDSSETPADVEGGTEAVAEATADQAPGGMQSDDVVEPEQTQDGL